jgi:hypothetical protein
MGTVTYMQFMKQHERMNKVGAINTYTIIKMAKKTNKIWLKDSDDCVLECSFEEAINGVANGEFNITNASKLKGAF